MRVKILGCILVAAVLSVTGCSQPAPEASDEEVLERMDALLSEIAGPQTAELDRGTRWRLIASTGTGLPPAGFQQGDLPEPGSRGAGLVQAYCRQCHGLSSPKMHTSAEWPLLVRRMLMRAEVLKYRLDGAETEAMVDEMLLAGLRSSQLPSAEDTDSLIAYFVRNGLPPAEPDEIPDTPDGQLYVDTCSGCHELPSPTAHGPEGAEALVARMSAMMQMLGMPAPTEEEAARLVGFLQAAAVE